MFDNNSMWINIGVWFGYDVMLLDFYFKGDIWKLIVY